MKIRDLIHRRTPRAIAALALSSATLGAMVTFSTSHAGATVTHTAVNVDGFQLDGDVAAGSFGNFCGAGATLNYNTKPPTLCSSSTTAGAQQPDDWSTLLQAGASGTGGDVTVKGSLPSKYIDTNAITDYALPDPTTYATGSKDILPISPAPGVSGDWQCAQSNNLAAKDDLINVYATTYRDSNNDLIVDFGAEKKSNLGDNNIGFWLFKDRNVGCSAGSKTIDFSGNHQNGDVLLTAAFTNGGTQATVQAFLWENAQFDSNGNVTNPGDLNLTPVVTSSLCPNPDGGTQLPTANNDVCAITNLGPVTPPWTSVSKAKNTLNNGTSLDTQEFYEGGLNLTALGDEGCFNKFLVDTRSSQSPTATIFDYADGRLDTCGPLNIHKYIDANANGVSDTGDLTADPPPSPATVGVSGWSFSVKNSSNVVVCSGLTDSTGTFACGSQPSGTYTVTETQITGFFNTQAGGTSTFNNTAGGQTISTTVTVGSGGGDVYFGNECYVAKTFEVDNVPTDSTAPTTMTAAWTINSGNHGGTATTGTVALSQVGTSTTWKSSAVTNVFTQDDNISWSFYINGDSTHKVLETTPYDGTATPPTGGEIVGHGYPACATTNSGPYGAATVTGFKYKDVINFGTYDSGAGMDLPAQGFKFELLNSGNVLQVATSDGSGVISFSNVNAGTYTVREVHDAAGAVCTKATAATTCVSGPPTGWQQTEPLLSGNPTDATVTVALGDTSDTVSSNFGDTPLSHFSTSFGNDATLPGTSTAATKATWSCKDSGNNAVGTPSGSNTGAAGDSATGQRIGTYTCTVVITDP